MQRTISGALSLPSRLPRPLLPQIATLTLIVISTVPPIDSAIADVESTKDSLPNIVLLLADDLGWADLACYGSDLHKTPNLDRLAKESVRFTDAYAAAPVCTPTRASILTGKTPARLHMTIWREASGNPPLKRKVVPPVTVGDLPHEEVTLAEVLHDAGYYTAHVGKWHLGGASYYRKRTGSMRISAVPTGALHRRSSIPTLAPGPSGTSFVTFRTWNSVSGRVPDRSSDGRSDSDYGSRP